MLADHFLKNIPDFRTLGLDHFLRGFNRGGNAIQFQLGVDKRLEQFQRHFLRQTTLVQFQLWTNHDH